MATTDYAISFTVDRSPTEVFNAINRAPIDRGSTEAIYEMRATTVTDHLDECRELLRARLDAANYPVQNIEVAEREQGDVELVATLTSTNVDPHELDGIVAQLAASPLVENASWNLRTTE